MNRSWWNRPRNYVFGAAALIASGVIIGLGLSAGLDLAPRSNAQDTHLAGMTVASSTLPESPFVSVVDRALPAVVFIETRRKGSDDGDAGDDLMRRLFGQNAPSPHNRMSPQSSGSGFIIDSRGDILTNNHVVRDAAEITVTLNDQRKFKAKLVGTDPQTDVAVIKIDGTDLPNLPLGDSDDLRIGDWAIAIGNPLGELRGSVTVGIISARGRANLNIFGSDDLRFQDFIQTDASINFGNSGGPLCNARGEAIGINTAINTSGQGIGFAIPINLAKHVSEQLISTGSVKRAMLGVALADLTPEMAEGFGIPGQQGVVISSVVPGQPAERAGIQRGDIVVAFDGQPVTDLQKLRLKVADTPVGRRVPVSVLRSGKRVDLSVTLATRDENVLAGNLTQPDATTSAPGGLTVRSLTEDERANLKVEGGVMVTQVDDASPAAEQGIQAGDVVEQVGNSPVKDTAGFARLVQAQQKQGRPVVLLLNRNGEARFISFRLN